MPILYVYIALAVPTSFINNIIIRFELRNASFVICLRIRTR